MASPVVAGLAALILSYYPDLSVQQVKQIIEQSAMKPSTTSFTKPGTEDEKTNLDQLSITGGIVNALDALKLASTTKGERKSAAGSPEKPIKKSKKK
jgi:subtilisin family serine protease